MDVLGLLFARWQLFLTVGVVLLLLKVYFSTREQHGLRIVASCLWLVCFIYLGWWMGDVLGLVLISVPLLIIYYYMLFHLALVIVPFSEPFNLREWWKRICLFFWYHWGAQYPLWVVPDTLSRKADERIKGGSWISFLPGLVWARSHQTVGLTTGLAYSGTRQAGTVFTGAFERPFAIVDLRTQLRTSKIEVVSSDGIPYHATLFTSFGVDKEKWDPALHHDIFRGNPILKGAKEPDCVRGTYVFSSARMLALLGTEAVASSSSASEIRPIVWDQRVLYLLEEAAREILSQRRLDELWQPQMDRADMNALDVIANAIEDKCSLALRQQGVRLYSCRIVNFEFAHKEDEQQREDEINLKQIKAWGADWQREAEQTRADGRAEADLMKQEARAYAYTNLLTAVAEGLEETRHLNPDLPRYVIAVRFISALERFIEEQPEGDDLSGVRASLAEVKKLMPWTGEPDIKS